MPNRLELMWATLRALHALGGRARSRELHDWVATDLDLGEELLTVRNKNGSLVYENRCGWARTVLRYIGAVVNPKAGRWALTERGGSIRSADELEALWTRWRESRESGGDRTGG